jgi:hypothetical protein
VKGLWLRSNIRRVLATSAIESVATGTAGCPDSLSGLECSRRGVFWCG